MRKLINTFNSKARVGRELAVTLIMSTALGGGISGVGMQSMGAWPKWLGGNYVSDEGCSCQDYKPVNEERNFH